MFQATQAPFCRPRHVPLWASFHQALGYDQELKEWSRSTDFEANLRALNNHKDMAQAAESESVDLQASPGRGHARHLLRHTEAKPEAFAYDEEELCLVASLVAAELSIWAWRGVVCSQF